jgi:hypothetical protein
MIRQIAPVFFTMDIPRTVAYYEAKLGFKCLGTWQDPPVYAIVARDQQPIHFRFAEPPTANPDKYWTNYSMHIYSSKMQTRFTLSTQPEAWNSFADLPTCRGSRVSLW